VLAASSDVVAPILETAYNEFRAKRSGVTVRTETTSTEKAFGELCRGEVDVVGASYELDPKAVGDPSCADRVAGFEIAHHTIPIIVNPENTWARCLTRAQLRGIWRNGSTITRWNQIDPRFPDEPVTFFGPPAGSVNAAVFNNEINGASGNHRDYQEVNLDLVAQNVAQSRDAVGFLDFVNYQTAGNTVRGLDLDDGKGCTPPNAITVGTGAYTPLCKPLWVYVSKDSLRTPATAAFINFYMSNAQDVAVKAHVVPRNDTTTRENVNRVHDLTAGVGSVAPA
jgi:ABC-type phosphate transport system substrate-binding protein